VHHGDWILVPGPKSEWGMGCDVIVTYASTVLIPTFILPTSTPPTSKPLFIPIDGEKVAIKFKYTPAVEFTGNTTMTERLS
jgi:hypothetical protein